MTELEEAKNKIAELEGRVASLSSEAEGKKALETQLSELRAKEKEAGVKAFIEDRKKEGKILPAFEKEIESLLMSASSEKVFTYSTEGKTVELSQRETVERLISGLPKLIEFSEVGRAGSDAFQAKTYTNAGEEVDRLTKVYMVEKKEKDYSVAMKAVLALNPELNKDYTGGK